MKQFIVIDTNKYHFVSSEEDYLSSEQVNPFLFANVQSLEHVVAPRGKSMNSKNDFEKALKIFCRHFSDSIQTTKTFADHICKLTAIHIQNACQFEWILNCDNMIDFVNTSFHLPH